MSIDHGLEPIPETKPLDSPMEKEYLSIAELVRRIPYRPQTLRNLMSQGVLKEGVHYFKPTQRKVVLMVGHPAMDRG
jgi:hypothetical protein